MELKVVVELEVKNALTFFNIVRPGTHGHTRNLRLFLTQLVNRQCTFCTRITCAVRLHAASKYIAVRTYRH